LAGKGLSSGGVSSPNDVNFQFEFPRFGRLPGPPVLNDSRKSVSPLVTTQQVPSPVERGHVSPRKSVQYATSTDSRTGLAQTPVQQDGGDMSSLSGLFSPSILDSVIKSSPFELLPKNAT